MSKQIWLVTARTHRDINNVGDADADGLFTVYRHWFTGYREAHIAYSEGERLAGVRHGITWELIPGVIDSAYAESDIQRLVTKVTA